MTGSQIKQHIFDRCSFETQAPVPLATAVHQICFKQERAPPLLYTEREPVAIFEVGLMFVSGRRRKGRKTVGGGGGGGVNAAGTKLQALVYDILLFQPLPSLVTP